MKKLVMAVMATMMLASTAMAQETNGKERKQMTKTEMIQQRTDGMVKRYSLSQEQAAKLLELNTQYADKLPGRGFGGPRMGRPHDGKGKVARPDSVGKGPRKERMNPEEMKKTMQAYESELKSILTEDQFKAYQEDRQKMMQHRPHNRRLASDT